jgi:tetratricopeptide (TPR) repeat protein
MSYRFHRFASLEQNQSQRANGEWMRGGFFWRKRPLCWIGSGYSSSGFALVLALVLASIANSQKLPIQPAAPPPSEYDRAVQTQDWPAALLAAQKQVDQEATPERLRRLAWTQLRARQLDAALATYNRALLTAEAQKPTPPAPTDAWNDTVSSLYLGKGNALLLLHRDTEAVTAYLRAAELAANPYVAWFNLCATLYNKGEAKPAQDACRSATSADPLHADAWFLLGTTLFVGQ